MVKTRLAGALNKLQIANNNIGMDTDDIVEEAI